ncbi:MAG: hypothetical protein ABH879_09620 [archaeon]
MALTEKQEEQLGKMPIVETRIQKSKDGKYIMHKTVITDIKPAEYYRVVLDKAAEPSEAGT